MKIIKKEIVIEAPAPKVWEHITDQKKLTGWLMPNDFEAAVGRKFYLECEHSGKMSCVVKEIVPNRKLVYSFQPKTFSVETLVTITLATEGRATRLTLVHSGWEALPPSEQGAADNYDNGWAPLLENLKKQLAASTTSGKSEVAMQQP
jgi:uncharacterized protein YndB with AHSA1/START domain